MESADVAEQGRGHVVIVLMGVAGSGKSTIGSMLAKALTCEYVDGDTLHPAANIEKMSRGIPLTDADRLPWLAAVREHIVRAYEENACLVVACSALKQGYRDFLAEGAVILWIYLKGPKQLLEARLQSRREHYMKASMLPSQFADLEEPTNAVVADVSQPPSTILQQLLAAIPAQRQEAAPPRRSQV